MDEQIRLRDDVIFKLKQQMATQQQRIADLEHRNKELSQIPIKEEGMSIIILYSNNSLCFLVRCMHNMCVLFACRR